MPYVATEAAYPIVDSGTYEIPDAVVLVRKRGTEHWVDLGDCDSGRAEITTNKIKRKSKNRKVRGVAKEIVLDVEAVLNIRGMQFTDDLRAISLLGDAVPHTQVAGPWTLNIKDARPGGLYWAGGLDISDVVGKEAVYDVDAGTFTPGDALAAGAFSVVDAPLGFIRLGTTGFAKGDSLQLTGTKNEIVANDNRTRIEFGTNTELDLEVMFRGVGVNGAKAVMHFYSWLCTPSGIDFIGADDFSGQDLSGALQLTNQGLGTWQRLSA